MIKAKEETKFDPAVVIQAIEEMTVNFRYLKSSIESLQKSIEGVEDRNRTIESLNLQIAHMRGSMETAEPVLATLLEGRISEKLIPKKTSTDTIEEERIYGSERFRPRC